MMKHDTSVAELADMSCRLEQAMSLMNTIAQEAEGRPNWQFMESRMRELKTRIARLCEDAQVLSFSRHGFYRAKGAA